MGYHNIRQKSRIGSHSPYTQFHLIFATKLKSAKKSKLTKVVTGIEREMRGEKEQNGFRGKQKKRKEQGKEIR
jgi:hypothetical protein